MTIEFYTKKNCPLCDDAKVLVDLIAELYQLPIEVIDIYENETFLEKYQLHIPVVCYNGHEIAYGRINYSELHEYFDKIL